MPIFRKMDKQAAGETKVQREILTLTQVVRGGRVSPDVLADELRKSQERLRRIRDEYEDVADLKNHPGWIRLEEDMRNEIERMVMVEHHNIAHEPELAWLNYWHIEWLRVHLLNPIELAVRERQNAEDRISDIDAKLEAMGGV